jgi:hypothetical protein
MATRRARPTEPEEPPKDWAPTQAAPNPILNNPYEEPLRHWSYVGGAPSETPGRRPASYWFKTQKIGTMQNKLLMHLSRRCGARTRSGSRCRSAAMLNGRGYAIKLLRLQNEMIQTFERYRRGNKQTVEVRHVHIHSGGQGVVGIINPPDDREGDG